jgi:hypothetical protein
VLETLQTSVTARMTALLDALRSDRYASLLDRLVDAANAPVVTTAAAEPAVEAIPALVRRPWHRLSKRAKDLGDAPTDHQLHDLRIRTKRARYAGRGRRARRREAGSCVRARRGEAPGRARRSQRRRRRGSVALGLGRYGTTTRLARPSSLPPRSARTPMRCAALGAAWDELADPRLRAWM